MRGQWTHEACNRRFAKGKNRAFDGKCVSDCGADECQLLVSAPHEPVRCTCDWADSVGERVYRDYPAQLDPQCAVHKSRASNDD